MRPDRDTDWDLKKQFRSRPEIEPRGATVTVVNGQITLMDLVVNSIRREQP